MPATQQTCCWVQPWGRFCFSGFAFSLTLWAAECSELPEGLGVGGGACLPSLLVEKSKHFLELFWASAWLLSSLTFA